MIHVRAGWLPLLVVGWVAAQDEPPPEIADLFKREREARTAFVQKLEREYQNSKDALLTAKRAKVGRGAHFGTRQEKEARVKELQAEVDLTMRVGTLCADGDACVWPPIGRSQGSIGKLPDPIEVIQIVNGTTALVRLGEDLDDIAMLKNIDASGYADGQSVPIAAIHNKGDATMELFQVRGTQSYTAANDAKRTVLVMEPLEVRQWLHLAKPLDKAKPGKKKSR